MTDNEFDSMRLWLCVTLTLIRLVTAPSCFQAYLNMAQDRLETLKKEAGRISNIELQRKVPAKPDEYSCVVLSLIEILICSQGGNNILLFVRRRLAVRGAHYPMPWFYFHEQNAG